MGTTKSPRLTEESNLDEEGNTVSFLAGHRGVPLSGLGNLLEALVVGLGLILDPASVLHGDDLPLGRLRTVALADDGLGDTHGSEFLWE